MNVNVMGMSFLRGVVLFVLFNVTTCYGIIHSTFTGHLRNGWGLRTTNHIYPCAGLKTSGSFMSHGIGPVVSYLKMLSIVTLTKGWILTIRKIQIYSTKSFNGLLSIIFRAHFFIYIR